MSSEFHITVAAVATDGAGKHLLVREAPDGVPVYNQPAGHLEPNESLIDAVVREVFEETCRHFMPTALIGIYRWSTAGGRIYLRHCFAGEIGPRRADCTLDPDIQAAEFVNPNALREGALVARSPLVTRAIDDYEVGKRFPLEILNDLS